MKVNIEVDGRSLSFTLDQELRRWHSEASLMESDFPLIAEVENRRYELFSDGTFADAELPLPRSRFATAALPASLLGHINGLRVRK